MCVQSYRLRENTMVDDASKSEIRSTWETAAPGWAKWEHVISEGLSDATETLLDMAGLRSGMRALDLACGSGSQTIQAAKRVGPNGRIVASDISATMLDHLRRNASRAGLENIEALECSADELDETPGLSPFDAAISRLALMLFPTPGEVLAAVQRVLKPRARFAALVFSTPQNNPFMAGPMAILLRHAGKSPPPPGRPGIFALGGEGILEGLLTESGFGDVRVARTRARLSLPGGADPLEMMQQAFGKYRAVVSNLDDRRRSDAWAEVREYLKQFDRGDGFRTELEFLIGSGAQPA
jgi:ubiquinone/menaquinone biosynthesis C-methylase UbiE